MTEHELQTPPDVGSAPTDVANSVSDHEAEIRDLRAGYEARLVMAHMKVEAVRAGMIDLDGLKLASLTNVRVDENGNLTGAREVIDGLRRDKPWLFNLPASSSSVAIAPPSQASRPRSALDMTDEEYVAARAAVISRRI